MLKDILKGAGSDTLKYFPVRLVPALTSLITVPVFTRMVERADYGNFYLISSATSLAAAVATAWITNSVVRFYWTYRGEDRQDDYVSTSVWSTVMSVLAVAAVILLGVWLARDSLSAGLLGLVPIGVASLCITYFGTVLLQVLRAANKATPFAIISIGVTLLGTAASVYLVAVPRLGSYGILLGMVIGNVLMLPFSLRMVAREGSLSPRKFSPDILKQYLSFGMPLVPAAISSWLLVLADRYIIEFTRTTAEVGLYSVAYGLGEKIMQLITLPLIIAMGPVMIQTFERQGQALAQRVQTQMTRYFALLTFPLLFGLAATSRHFMQVFTGPDYRAAFPILAIVAAGSLSYGLVQIAGNGIALHKKSTITMTNTMTAGVFNIVTNIVFVPRFGYMAAAYTTLASYALLLALTWYRSRPYMEWVIPWADLARIAAVCGAMWAAIALTLGRVPGNIGVLLAEVALGAVVYIAGIFVTGAVRADERAYVRDLAARVWRRLSGRAR